MSIKPMSQLRNISGVGVFQFFLNDTNGFNRVGGYNLSFAFGVDLLNETGFQIREAPRRYIEIMVNINQESIIDAEIADDIRDSERIDRQEDNLNTAMWFTFCIVGFLVVFILILYIKPVRLYNNIKSKLNKGHIFVASLWSTMRVRKAYQRNPAIAYNLLGVIFQVKAQDVHKNEVLPLTDKLDKAEQEQAALEKKSIAFFEKERQYQKAKALMDDKEVSKRMRAMKEMPKDVPSNPTKKNNKKTTTKKGRKVKHKVVKND
jgi:hypothetical protein